jgi:anti-sigma28 factor (negative regulator of flagellin synthesis)
MANAFGVTGTVPADHALRHLAVEPSYRPTPPVEDSTSPPQSDRVSLRLASLVARAIESDGDRPERVEHLRRSYQAGTYQPDNAELARLLVDEWAERVLLPPESSSNADTGRPVAH